MRGRSGEREGASGRTSAPPSRRGPGAHRVRRTMAIVVAAALVVVASGCNKPFDFNGDDKADVVWVDTSTGVWFQQTVPDPGPMDPPMPPATTLFTNPLNDFPVPGDYDGSGKYTTAHFSGSWITEGPAGTISWSPVGGRIGQPRWLVPGAYDGNHKTLPAFYMEDAATWYVYGHDPVQFGSPGTGHYDWDMPVPADYDGDGTTDLATYSPWTATWTIRNSRDLSITTTVLGGGPAGFPTAGDFNGDGKAEPAWLSFAGVWTVAGLPSIQVQGGDPILPAVADYDGDGKDDLAASIGGLGSSMGGLWRFGGHPTIPLTRPSSSSGMVLMTTSRLEFVVQISRLSLLQGCKTNPSSGCPS